MRKVLKKINDVFSWVIMFGMAILLVFTMFNVSNSAKTGEGAFLFGYRPVFILTGSMEPYMMTNGICLTKQVTDIAEIDVGDVITFHVGEGEDKLVITHRIVSIENGFINTKGDNNNVSDDLMLTMDNVEAKVICVFNQTAWLIAKWETTSGKIMIISFTLALIFAYFLLKSFIKSLFSKKKDEDENKASEASNENIIEGEGATVSAAAPAPAQTPPGSEDKD